MIIDPAMYLLYPRTELTWLDGVALALIVLVDAALATSAQRSGVVAWAVAALQLLIPLVMGVGNRNVCNAGGMVAAYRVGAWLRTGPAIAALAALAVADIAGGKLLLAPTLGLLPYLLAVLSTDVLPWFVGRHTTARGAHIADLEQQAERRHHAEESAIRRALAEERSAIARDLHDMISHHVSAIGVHAGAARLGLGTQESTAVQRSLNAVETASRSAMTDLRRLLDLLHGNHERAHHSQPGIDNVEVLLAGVRAAGLPVTMTTRGRPLDLPGSVDVALYRILQEALTNALRHGGGSPAEVEVDNHEDEVVLTVTNTLRDKGNPAEHNGSPQLGLTGIRERAALFEGEVRCGPTPDGARWSVRVALPTGERR